MTKKVAVDHDGMPLAKIPRLDDSECCRILPILSDELERTEIPLEKFYVAKLEDKRDIGKVLKVVPEIEASFSHLKRVDKLGRVLIKAVAGELNEDLKSLLQSSSNNLIIEVANVPKIKPITRRQFDWAKQHWSTAFHPNKEVEDLLIGDYFSTEGLAYVKKWIDLALDVGCVVVQNGEELARGSQGEKLLSHPVINMVEMLSKMERKENDYLATGCDVFLRFEPCAMCSMALVHSRANRVFFVEENSRGTLAKSHWQLHLESSINHHYKVFQVLV